MEMLNIKTAVVTGPTGAIGTALCAALLARGMAVYAVCRPGSPRAAALPNNENLKLVYCDAANYNALPGLIAPGAQAFFHLAWKGTTGAGRNDMIAQTDNIRYTIDAVRAAAALGCGVFVGAGSQAEYGRVEGTLRPDTPARPENGYGMAKLCAGQMSRMECERLGLRQVWLRVLSVYGPHDAPGSMVSTLIRTLLAGGCPPLTKGEQLWDYLYSGDAAEAFCLAAQRGRHGAVYTLGSGSAQPLRSYAEAVRDAINPALPLGIGELPYAEKQVMHLCADLTDIARDTGFAPGTGFAEGIQKTIDWVRNENNE